MPPLIMPIITAKYALPSIMACANARLAVESITFQCAEIALLQARAHGQIFLPGRSAACHIQQKQEKKVNER